MLAYHNDAKIKKSVIAEMAAHRKADELVQGYGYWKDGKKNGVFLSYDMFGDTLDFKTYKEDKRDGLFAVYKEQWSPEIKKMELMPETMGMFENESPTGYWFYGIAGH